VLFGGGVVNAMKARCSFLLVAAASTGAGIVAPRALLTVFAVLALAFRLGARTTYLQAIYKFGIDEPALTVFLLTVLSIGSIRAKRRAADDSAWL
jgi:hypothetical protein